MKCARNGSKQDNKQTKHGTVMPSACTPRQTTVDDAVRKNAAKISIMGSGTWVATPVPNLRKLIVTGVSLSLVHNWLVGWLVGWQAGLNSHVQKANNLKCVAEPWNVQFKLALEFLWSSHVRAKTD
jgi:hypothetical protein